MTSPSTTSPKNKTDVDYGSIPTMDSVTKATILDELDPLVQERIKAQKQKRLGVAASVALLLVVLAAVTLTQKKTPSQVEDPKTTLDHRFASLLVDDQAFFFPTETSRNAGSRRSLASEGPDATASSANPWALAWTDNKDGYAAVGAYYHAKGKAIGHYYKSLYKPKHNKTAEEAGVANVTLTEAAPWTFDWKKDSPAAIAMSQKYQAIGDAIEDHYKQAFAPTASPPSDASDDAGSTRRYLRVLKKDSSDQDAAAAAAPAYDWAADRARGIAIGQHFQELGQQIKEHYEKAYDELAKSDVAAPVDWSSTWTDLKAQGQAIGAYYRDKGVAMARFYEQEREAANSDSANLVNRKVSLWNARSASLAPPASMDADAATATTAKNDWYIWGMDWQHGKDQAMNLHEEMKAKGQAIAAYYRAKFDPTLLTNALDDLSFPSWGDDAEKDKAHGKAIGEYWAAHGKQLGKEQKKLWKQTDEKDESSATASPADFWQQQQGDSWKERGQSIGKFWEDFYRSRFDPTYDSKRDLN